ncbi:MAG: hypothetical protein ACLFPL_00540 [Candidatus Nanoarchaeia archaeon]
MESLYTKFTRLRGNNGSLIVLGLDPKDEKQFERVQDLVGYDEKEGFTNIVGFKPNAQFYQSPQGQQFLQRFEDIEGLRIIDAKLADGTNTNKAAIQSYAPNFDAITLNTPDVEGTVRIGEDNGLASIIMGTMSFPSTLQRLNSNYGFNMLRDEINRGIQAGAQGIVMGTTSYIPENKVGEAVDKLRTKIDSEDVEHLCVAEMTNKTLEESISKRNELFEYCVAAMGDNPKLLALVPGFGRQGGNLEYFLTSGIDLNRCIINAGSDILKAEDPHKALGEMNDVINSYRNK